MQPLITIPPELISSGLYPAVPPNVQPFWADGRNIIFRDGGIRPEPAQSLYFSKLEKGPIRGMLEIRQDMARRLYFGTLTKLFKYNPDTKVVSIVGSGYTGAASETPTALAHRWAMVSWGDWVIASAASQRILVDKNAGAGFVELTGTPAAATPFKPELLVKYGPHLVAFNHNDGQAGHVTMYWCTDNNPEIWDAAADNSAGETPIHDAPSPFRAALRYGNGIVAFTDNTLHTIAYIGDPFYFGTQGRLEGLGAVSKHSVVEANGRLYGWGPRGIWVSDATSVDYIDHPAVRDMVYNDLNRRQLSQIHAWHDVANERIVWWYCSKESLVLNRAVGVHYKENLWHIPDYVREASSEHEVFDYPIVGDSDGNVYLVGIPGGLPPVPYAPITLYARSSIGGSGYGEHGYGELGYGSAWSGDA